MITKDRLYRPVEMRLADEDMVIEGRAVVYDSPAVLYEADGIEYKEIIERGALTNAKMDDVVLVYNHDGKPMARTRNGSLELIHTDAGLDIRANLSATREGREMYESIKAGLLDRMSFSFIADKDAYDRNTHTRRVRSIKRLFDCSIVDFPAYDKTLVYARSYFEAEAEKERVEARAALELAMAKYDYLEVE